MTDYLALLEAMNSETPRGGTDKTAKTPAEGSSVSFVSRGYGRFKKIMPPSATCSTCRHWWRHPNQTATGDCLRNHFETNSGDDCKRHEPQLGSAHRAA